MPLDAGIQTAFKRLREASERLKHVRRPGWGKEASRLEAKLTDDGVVVWWLLNEDALFQPSEGEEIFTEIFRILASPQVAPWLAKLTLEGHQIAANGTIDWEIGPIAYAELPFSRLRVFHVESVADRGAPCFVGTLKGRHWEDRTVATRLLDLMPVLEELAIPEPPKEAAFFQGDSHPLRKLSVFDVDYHSFVLNLAACNRFPQLEEICLRESFRTDVNRRLPASHYARLFESDAFPALCVVELAQVDLTDNHIGLLRKTRVGRQLSRLLVKPVESWCDRPILHAQPED